MNSRPGLTTSPRGFTLVELVTTIVIIGILAAVGLPRMFDNQSFQERGYIDEVASTIRYAQKIAIASRCEVSVTLGAGGYNAVQRNTLINCNLGAEPWTRQVRRSDGSNVTGTAPAGVVMAPNAVLIFNDEGVISNGNPPVFTVGIFALSVNQTTGMVTVVP